MHEDSAPQLETARKWLASVTASCVVGQIACENWSQSARGAGKLADDIRARRQVRERATRAKRSS